MYMIVVKLDLITGVWHIIVVYMHNFLVGFVCILLLDK